MNLEEDRVKLRTQPLKDLINIYEKKRDQLLDKLSLIKGHTESLETVILNLHQKIEMIEKEEESYKVYQKAKQEAVAKMTTEAVSQAHEKAKEVGNVGKHPSERAAKLAERKKKAKTTKKKTTKKKTTKKKKPKYQTQKKT